MVKGQTTQGEDRAPRPIRSMKIWIAWRGAWPVPPISKSLGASYEGILLFLLQFQGHHGLFAGTNRLLTNHSVPTEASPWGSGKDKPGHLSSPFLHPTPYPFPQTWCSQHNIRNTQRQSTAALECVRVAGRSQVWWVNYWRQKQVWERMIHDRHASDNINGRETGVDGGKQVREQRGRGGG